MKTSAPILVNLNDLAEAGSRQLIVRMRTADADRVRRAAGALDMAQSEFTRTALVRAAERVLKNEGIE